MKQFLFAFVLMACSGFLFAQTTHIVTLQGVEFTPADITISVGDIVEWQNQSGFHNVNGNISGNPESFSSGAPTSDLFTFTHTFTIPGVYNYVCDIHAGQGMEGTVTVTGGATGSMLITGVIDGPLSGGTPKALELYVLEDIPDLSIFGIGSANNGTGSNGVEFTFPAVSANEGDCIFIASDSMQFESFFGFFPDYVDDGALAINGDDALELFKDDVVVDVFGEIDVDGTGQPWEYLDGWAYRQDGTGPDGNVFDISNWTFSGINELDGETSNSTAMVPFPNCTFFSIPPMFIDAVNDVDETEVNTPVAIDVLANDILPNGISSLEIVTFPANGIASPNALIEIAYEPDMDYCGEDSFTYEICDGQSCDTALVTLTIECPSNFPTYSIGTVTADSDNDFNVDSIGIDCELHGTVYGINIRGNDGGFQFTIIDGNNDGIGVFNGNDDLGYTVQEGDSIAVVGTITQFRGLAQIEAEEVTLIAQDRDLFDPTVVSALGEDTESHLIRINNLTVTESDTANSGINYTVFDGANEYVLRIDKDVTDIFSISFPGNGVIFDAIGIGGQFNPSTDPPFDAGYQFLPRYLEDIIIVSSTNTPEWANDVTIFPNPVSESLNVQSTVELDQVIVRNVLGQVVEWVDAPQTNVVINMNNFENGVYLLTLIVDGEIITRKVVKQ